MVKVISVLNMKGGVGKTTICLNLAYALANRKSKVLIVDFDPQANASGGLLAFDEYEKHRDNRKVISDIFTDLEKIVGPVSKKNASLLTLDDMKTRAKSFDSGGYIDLVPSELELSHVLERSGGSSFEDRLKLILRGKKNQYDYVLVDCGPTYSVLTNNALKASDSVLIPVKPDPFSARGIPLLLSKINAHNLAHEGDDKVAVLGIVFNMVDDSLMYQAGVKGDIYREHKDVFAEIRYAEHYSRAIIERKSIYETNIQAQFTDNFSKFVDEFKARAGV
jgi:chromosome partitioning protein